MLVAPSALLLGLPNPAQATCAVTSGGGTMAVPANGSTVTCAVTGGTHTTQVGDNTTNATVIVEDNAAIDTTGIGGFLDGSIKLNNATVTLGANASLTDSDPSSVGIYAVVDAVVTMGANSSIKGSYGIAALGDAVVTMGTGSSIVTTASSAIYAGGMSTVTLDEGASVLSTGFFGTAISGAGNITLANNSSVVATGAGSTGIQGTVGNDTFDISGAVQGTSAAIGLGGGDDTLILREGAQLAGQVIGLGGIDTVQLFGTNNEDDDFTGFESLQMDGVDWTLSGSSTFGTADINSGILKNNGTMTANVNVHAGGTFGGTSGTTGGTVGDVINDGTIAPGDGSTATHIIVGNYVQNAGGALEIEFDAGSVDSLSILGGNATLDGTVRFVELSGGVVDGTVYTFLRSSFGGGIAGNFSNIIGPLFFNPVVAQVGNDMQVTLNRLSIASSPSAQTSNQQSVAAAIDAALANDPASIASIDSLLNNAGNIEDASNILASQSGLIQSASIASGLSAMGQGHSVVTGRLSRPPGSVSGLSAGDKISDEISGDVAASDEGAVWAQATRSFSDIDGDSSARGADYTATGMLAGAEKYLDKDTIIGAFGGFSVTKTELEDLQDEATTQTLQIGAFASRKAGNWSISASLSGAHLDFDTERPTPAGLASAEFKGYGGFANAEISYGLDYQGWRFSPLLGFEAATIHHENYDESGAGALNLSVNSQTTSQLKSILGLGATGDLALGQSFTLTPTARIAWAHEFADRSSDTSASFASAPAIAFQSSGPEKSRDEARLNLDLLAKRFEGPGDDFAASLYAAYDGTLASTHNNHAITAGLKFNW